jgi:5-methylthioadenosine/S-adenosylhomocysteine deaminase
MFEEIRLASFLAKGFSGDPTALPAEQAMIMGTRMGANALHIGHLTGSLEVGKRADLILIDRNPLHRMPHFKRTPDSIYAELVYSAKSTDVSDVMVNGKWLMQDRKLLTIDQKDILQASQDYAKKIDIFLIKREQSVLSKLIAIGGATEEESFEVQAKVAIQNIDSVLKAVNNPKIKIIRSRHYREYDTYFSFADAEQGYIRYREDHFIDEKGETTNVRSRLTHLGTSVEHRFPKEVLLSRSRFLAPATQSLRFYKEYFKPNQEVEINKDRLRFLVSFKNTEFFINVDTITTPEKGHFLEIKSRTWSLRDAERKSKLAIELIKVLGENPESTFPKDYFELVKS